MLIVLLWMCGLARADMVVTAYDSLTGKHGWLTAVVPLFEKECACKVSVLPSGDGGQLVTRLELDQERGKSSGDVVVGLDQHVWERAKPLVEPWGKWRPKGYEKLAREARAIPAAEGFLPFDFGAFAFIADTKRLGEKKLAAPRSLKDLVRPEYKRQLILEDPRTSTPGLAFLLFTDSPFWKAFRGQWLTLAAGWDAAYGLFLRGEAPLVWSYVTSQAYHREHGDSEGRYRAVVLDEGAPLQLEGAAIVKGRATETARAFLGFLLSEKAQALLPKTQWMMPARAGVELPESFKSLPKPKKTVFVKSGATGLKARLAEWEKGLAE